jgi:hypothetical protein
VAYFERTGSIDGDADVLLKFKTEEINDILKSLVLFGNVSGVSYGSRDPIARALKSFGIDISGEPTLAQLLSQLRGAAVVVQAPDAIAGKVLGVGARTAIVASTGSSPGRAPPDDRQGIRAPRLETSRRHARRRKLHGEVNEALA